MRRRTIGMTAALWLLWIVNGPVASAQRSGMNVESLIRQAGMIFAGRVIKVETGTKDRRMNLYMTYYTFAVSDSIYGAGADTVRIKQYGGQAGGRHFYPPGVPRFEVGEEVMVMLYPLSNIGMTSTVGKNQGKFFIFTEDSSGRKTIANQLDNKGLFRRLRHHDLITNQEWIPDPPPRMPYNEFIETVRQFVAVLKKTH